MTRMTVKASELMAGDVVECDFHTVNGIPVKRVVRSVELVADVEWTDACGMLFDLDRIVTIERP